MNPHAYAGGRPRVRMAALLATALVLVLPSIAPAATYYVDKDSVGGRCSDARTAAQNTITTPWCTIPVALKGVPLGPGHTLLVRRAAYPRVITSNVKRDAYLTVMPYGTEVPTIQLLDLTSSSFLRFERLKFIGAVFSRKSTDMQYVRNEVALKPAGTSTQSGFTLQETTRALVQANFVHDGRDAVNIGGAGLPARQVVVMDNLFQDMGNDGVHIRKSTQQVLVASNTFLRVRMRKDVDPYAHSDAIQAGGPTTGVIVWGNTVAGGRGFLFHVAPTDKDKAGMGHRGLVFENNLLVGPDFGIRLWSTPGVEIVNNTVYGTGISDAGGIHLNDRMGTMNDRTTGAVLVNNVAKWLRIEGDVGFAARDYNLITGGPLAGPNDLRGTPSFVDPAAGDYRLKLGTLGVDRATTAWAPTLDLAYRDRTTRPDLGALESSGTVVTRGTFARMPPGAADLALATGAAE